MDPFCGEKSDPLSVDKVNENLHVLLLGPSGGYPRTPIRKGGGYCTFRAPPSYDRSIFDHSFSGWNPSSEARVLGRSICFGLPSAAVAGLCIAAFLQEGSLREGTLQEGTLQECTLQECTLQDGTLRECTLWEGTLWECTLQEGTLLEGTLLETTLLESTLLENTL